MSRIDRILTKLAYYIVVGILRKLNLRNERLSCAREVFQFSDGRLQEVAMKNREIFLLVLLSIALAFSFILPASMLNATPLVAQGQVTPMVAAGGYVLRSLPTPGCFIATAGHGTPMAEEIQVLREFRDEYLLTNPLGQALVGVYYRFSPPMAEFITDHPGLKSVVRAASLPAVAIGTIVVDTTPVEKMAITSLLVLVSVSLAIWATRPPSKGQNTTEFEIEHLPAAILPLFCGSTRPI